MLDLFKKLSIASLFLLAAAAWLWVDTVQGLQPLPKYVQAMPELSIAYNIPADPLSTVTVPVRLASNGYALAALTFSIDYQQEFLFFDSDLPNAIDFILPDDFEAGCAFKPEEIDAEIQCFLHSAGVPPQPVVDGTFLKIILRTTNPESGTMARVGFLNNAESPVFITVNGEKVAGKTTDGSVRIGLPVVYYRNSYLGMVSRQHPGVSIRQVYLSLLARKYSGLGQPVCQESILNGGFEITGKNWQIPISTCLAIYSNAQAHTGKQSAFTGILPGPGAANLKCSSDIRQVVNIPEDVTSVILRYWMYQVSSETILQAQTQELAPEGISGYTGDLQYAQILDRYGKELYVLSKQLKNRREWVMKEFVLPLAVKGRTIQINFGAYNNGIDGVTGMYIDNVSLEVCRLP